MDCRQLSAVLELEVDEARCSRVEVRGHLADCLCCRERHPELELLLDRPPAPGLPGLPRLALPRGHGVAARVAVAAALLLGLVLVLQPFRVLPPSPAGDRRELPPSRPAAQVPGGVLRTHVLIVQRGRRMTSTITRAVWTPPRPSCLPVGESEQ